MEIKDRVAIVTGGGGGIGSAVARRWMADGARAVGQNAVCNLSYN